MEELDFEQCLITPQRTVGTEADIAVVVIADLGERLRQLFAVFPIRLLSTLLLGADGAIGLLFANWAVNFFFLFPDNFVRAFVGGIIAAAAPYAVYRLAQERYGLDASLANLTPKRLLVLVFAYSVASPLLHHIWFALRGDTGHLVKDFCVMFIGDLSGSLIIVYALKGLLALTPRAKSTHGRAD